MNNDLFLLNRVTGDQGAEGGGRVDGPHQPEHRDGADEQGPGRQGLLPAHHTALRRGGHRVRAPGRHPPHLRRPGG